VSALEVSGDATSVRETPPAGALQRLLEVEQEAEEALVRAQTQARELVAAARERALASEEEARHDVARAGQRIEREIHAWRDERLAALQAQSEGAARAYEEAASARIGELARVVVDEILAFDEAGRP
jgi:DNA primase large subunit